MSLLSLPETSFTPDASAKCSTFGRSGASFQSLVPGFLNTCIDAYEAAGLPYDSLAHLQELVDWKRTWMADKVEYVRARARMEASFEGLTGLLRRAATDIGCR